MKKRFGFWMTVVLALCFACFVTCSNGTSGNPSEFTTAPVVTLTAGDGSLKVEWADSVPKASSYDIYYIERSTGSTKAVKGGKKLTNRSSGRTISGLTSGSTYSVVVTANKSGYTSIDSAIEQETLAGGLTLSNNRRSPKRGICYGNSNNDPFRNHTQNMAALAPGTSWMYTWGLTAPNDLANPAVANNIVFIPMIFRGTWNQNELRNYLTAHPEVEYILTYNEPMFSDQAKMTPAEAGAAWPNVKSIAQEFNLKIVGPALNYGSFYDDVGILYQHTHTCDRPAQHGTPCSQPNSHHGPKCWFEEFLAQPNVNLSDMHAIAVHTYSGDPKAQKWNSVVMYSGYGLPLWLTEFCAWDDDWYTKNALHQEKFMSEFIIYLEQEPIIERYAWFMANGGNGGLTSWPFFNLVNSSGLTSLGQIFVNMSTCDKSFWEPAGTTIKAAQFSANHLSEIVGAQDTWPSGFPGTGGSVHFRPTTDNDANAQVLDIYNFNGNRKWVEYQINTPSTKTYTLTLRYQTVQPTSMSITIDSGSQQTTSLDSSNWNTATVDLGNIAAGKHTIRLAVTGGDCALNWLKVE